MLLGRTRHDNLHSLPSLVNAPCKTGSRILSRFFCVEINSSLTASVRASWRQSKCYRWVFSPCICRTKENPIEFLAVLNHDRVWQEVRFSEASQPICFTSCRSNYLFHTKCWKLWPEVSVLWGFGDASKGPLQKRLQHQWDVRRGFPILYKAAQGFAVPFVMAMLKWSASTSAAFCRSCLLVCWGQSRMFCCCIFQGLGICHTYLLEQQNL